MIKQTLIATALIAGLAAPAFAADNGHHDRGRDAHQPPQSSHQTYQHPTHTQPRYVAPQRQYQAPQRQYQQAQHRYQQARYNGYTAQVYHPRYAPPRARYEQRPADRQGYVWQPGYYQYDNGQQYNWIPGQYIQQPYADAQYQPLNWQLLNGLWTLLGGNFQ